MYSVDYIDISAYGDAKLPTLPSGIQEVTALGAELKPFDLDFKTVLAQVKETTKEFSGVYDEQYRQQIDKRHRSSEFCIVDTALSTKLAERLTFVVNWHVRQASWCLSENLQFLCYDAKNSGHFSKHTDSAYWHGSKFMYTSPHRKLTTVTYLNDDYEGGELILHTVRYQNGKHYSCKPSPGTMVIFPSDLRFPHEVRPVTKGQRYSIVGWFDYVK